MINFKVTAPGKINLFGENLTCDDHNGVMASIHLRSTIKFNELPLSKAVITLEFPAINLNCTIYLPQFRKFYKSCTFDDTVFDQIHQFISSAYLWDNDDQKMIVHILFYLLAYITYNENIDIEDVTPFQVYLETPLLNVNFGGLASIVVCLTTCLLHWSNLRRNANHELNDNDRAKILMYSKSCHKIFTSCMFKSDVTVSTYGSMLRYRCKDSSQNELVLNNMPRMRVLMVDSTVNLVKTEAKANLINCYPHIANSILDSIRIISDKAFSVLKKIHDMNKKADTYTQDVSAQEKELFPLIRMQQELNEIFTLFNEHMHTVCRIAQRYKLCGKCADFNMGKYTYIWCPSDRNIEGTNTMLMVHDLTSKGFDVKLIDLNCDGVKVE